jgi:hypothetical protein
MATKKTNTTTARAVQPAEKEEALKKIKALRDEINDVPDPANTDWTNEVCFYLDAAADVIEFPPVAEEGRAAR